MTFSYGDPALEQKDAIRLQSQDGNSSEPILQDEEINYVLSRWLPVYNTLEGVASVVANNIAARYAREATYSADGVSISLGQVAQQFRELAASLREQHKNLLVGGFPDVGGISPYEQPDPTIAPFSFGTGMHDDLEAGPQDYGSRYPLWYAAEYQPGV